MLPSLETSEGWQQGRHSTVVSLPQQIDSCQYGKVDVKTIIIKQMSQVLELIQLITSPKIYNLVPINYYYY